MVHIPRIVFRFKDSIHGAVLLHGDFEYILYTITIWREASILHDAFKHLYQHTEWPVSPRFDLPYTNEDIRTHRAAKYADHPFLVRDRSYQKGYRAGHLYLPFHSFKFHRCHSSEIRGHEQVTQHVYRSQLDPRLSIPLSKDVEPVPELIDQAKEALGFYLQKQRLSTAASKALDEAERHYFKLDPTGKFLSRFKDVTQNLAGESEGAS